MKYVFSNENNFVLISILKLLKLSNFSLLYSLTFVIEFSNN